MRLGDTDLQDPILILFSSLIYCMTMKKSFQCYFQFKPKYLTDLGKKFFKTDNLLSLGFRYHVIFKCKTSI